MQDLENIHKTNWKYRMLYPYVQMMHNYVFYQRFYVLNPERIPKNKPVVAISNHQNGLSDALGILFAFSKDGRPPVFIARADIFKKPIAAKALRFLRIMPAYRQVDVGMENVKNNYKVFEQGSKVLCDNGVMALFPEAGHQDRHFLGTFKKGFARIAFQAAEMMDFKEPVYVLPMSNHYSSYFSVQGRLAITIGEPIDISYLYDTYKTEPALAMKRLADRARVEVEKLMLNIQTEEYYEQYMMLCEIYGRDILQREQSLVVKSADGSKEKHRIFTDPRDLPAQLRVGKQIVAKLDQYAVEHPEQYAELMNDTYRYIRAIEKLHLRDWIFSQKLWFWGTLGRTLLALLALPFVLLGWFLYLVPSNVSFLITRRIEDRMLHSSFHFAIWTLVAFPIWFIILSLIIGFTTHLWWIIPILFVASLLTVIFYFRAKVMLKKVYNRLRRYRMWFRGNYIYKNAVRTRASILKRLPDVMGD
ncbi:MAG: 1-acyl-sn-glycerol-3-phosphate acyltransferase [Fibrobacter sp.]|nr:1-acyl-sn-glycerol-3-phosphate acyltransferase [Bacteroidales bacterium]MCF0225423.1 1-acyl-sn-glycerol-3-phosphate acyltransferase [Fibrobacter sp.]